jgi:hypothetical protein
MGLKVVLILPVILLGAYPVIQLGISLGVVVSFAAFAMKYKPFLSDELDVVESVSRITVVFSVLFTLLIRNNITIEALNLDTDAYGMAINVCNLAALLLFVLFMLYSLPSVKLSVKNWRQNLTFVDSMTLMEGAAERIVPHWHVDTEIRHRIWYEFWTNSLVQIGGEDCRVSSEGDRGQR